jgi:hypothetical protein
MLDAIHGLTSGKFARGNSARFGMRPNALAPVRPHAEYARAITRPRDTGNDRNKKGEKTEAGIAVKNDRLFERTVYRPSPSFATGSHQKIENE